MVSGEGKKLEVKNNLSVHIRRSALPEVFVADLVTHNAVCPMLRWNNCKKRI